MGAEWDSTKPNGHLTWENRTMANHVSDLVYQWITSPDRVTQHHPVTHPVPSGFIYPAREYHPWHINRRNGGKKDPGWYSTNEEWEDRHHSWTSVGVRLSELRDHILCTVLMIMLAGAAPPCWEEDWIIRPQNLAEWCRLNYDLILIMARTFNGSGGLNVHEFQIPGGFPTRWNASTGTECKPRTQ